jgi:hypothetical protein
MLKRLIYCKYMNFVHPQSTHIVIINTTLVMTSRGSATEAVTRGYEQHNEY